MDKRLSITVDGGAYPVKFGYKATLKLGKKWELPGLMEVYQHALQILAVDGEDPEKTDLENVDEEKLGKSILSFDNLEIMKDLTYEGILHGAGKKEIDLDPDELMDVILNDLPVITEIFKAFIDSMPKAKEQKQAKTTGKQKAPATTRGKKSA